MLTKIASLHVLTGRMGAGKTTLARKLSSKYDLVVQTDMPRPMNEKTGQYDEPTKAEKEKIRAERRAKVLAASRSGKKVLLEGHPPGVIKLMREGLKEADRVFIMPFSRKDSFRRVAERALADPEYDLETDMDAAAHNNDLFDHYLKKIEKVHPVEVYREGIEKTAAKEAPSLGHQEKLDNHFASSDPKKWRQFRRALRSRGFAEAVKQDDRSDRALKNFAMNVGKHLMSKDSGVAIQGSSGKQYKVKHHPDEDSYSCSCPHWTYQLAGSNKSGDCKHITQVRSSMEKRALHPAVKALLRVGNVDRNREKSDENAWKAAIADRAYRKNVPKDLQPKGFFPAGLTKHAARRPY